MAKNSYRDLMAFFIPPMYVDHNNRKEKISYGGFLSYHLDSKANPAHQAAYFCPKQCCPQKATVGYFFLACFFDLHTQET